MEKAQLLKTIIFAIKVIAAPLIFYFLFALGEDHLQTKAFLLALYGMIMMAEALILNLGKKKDAIFGLLYGAMFIIFPLIHQMQLFLFFGIIILGIQLSLLFRGKRVQD